MLIDGGYVNPVPYDVIMDRADVTVAVDVTGDTTRGPAPPFRARSTAMTGAAQILFHSITREKLKSVRPRHLHPAGGRRLRLARLLSSIEEIFCAAEPAKQ